MPQNIATNARYEGPSSRLTPELEEAGPLLPPHNVSVYRYHLRNRVMKQGRWYRTVIRAAGGIGEIGEAMPAMVRIDGGGKTSGFAEEPRDGEIAVIMRHGLREFAVGIAGRLRDIEHHVVARRLTPPVPGGIGLRLGQGRLLRHTSYKSDAAVGKSRPTKNGTAIFQNQVQLARFQRHFVGTMKADQYEERSLHTHPVMHQTDY